MTQYPVVAFDDVSKIYGSGDTEVRALDGVNLAIESGEFVAIMGASGSGKSTAMNIIGCLDAPTSGTFRFRGVDVGALEASVPVGRFTHPFVFRTRGPALGPAPARIAGVTQTPLAAGVEIAVTVVPQQPGVAVTFVAPPDVTPARSNLPGVVRLGRWRATYVGPRPDGVIWRASFAAAHAAALAQTRVIVTSGRFPGGTGWQQLPAWLPQERTVWTAAALWILTPRPDAGWGVAPVQPLR